MIVEFLNHPITLELKQGIGAKNISGTLGGATNLYSFIGFEGDSDPTEIVEDLLQQTSFQFLGARGKSINFSFYIPDSQEIFAVTPMPWAPGRSWAKGIESGISGLGYYLKNSPHVVSAGDTHLTCYAVFVKSPLPLGGTTCLTLLV